MGHDRGTMRPEPDLLPPPVVAAPLRTPARGLAEAEAEARQARGEGNAHRSPTSRTYWEIFRQNAYLGINGILIGVSLLLVAFGMYVEAALTAGPVIANIFIGVIQETRAKRKLDRIALLNRPRARVIRDGVERAIDPAAVVLGDLVVARRGDQVLLDGTIVGAGRAEVDQSLLSGESDAIVKVAGDAVLFGSAVVSGTLFYQVERVGADSFANRLLAEAKKLGNERTPLQREIAATIWAVAGLVLATSVPVAIALVAIPGGFDSKETLTAAAVLVTLVPQGLAIMITVTYAAGALRITRLGALVQRQNAVESMARVDTLCLDKTGTLTTQRISFSVAEPAAGRDPESLRAILAALAASTTRPEPDDGGAGRGAPGGRASRGGRDPLRLRAAVVRAPLRRRPGGGAGHGRGRRGAGSHLRHGRPRGALAPSRGAAGQPRGAGRRDRGGGHPGPSPGPRPRRRLPARRGRSAGASRRAPAGRPAGLHRGAGPTSPRSSAGSLAPAWTSR